MGAKFSEHNSTARVVTAHSDHEHPIHPVWGLGIDVPAQVGRCVVTAIFPTASKLGDRSNSSTPPTGKETPNCEALNPKGNIERQGCLVAVVKVMNPSRPLPVALC